ncbi:ABC transporter substrate-binding protein [Thalassobacillus hwangdonensis]|uniref:ABC transporter substrate-binding protein n=1 Tax=Thalassobacillus hwangdonensis TaxID=546108 RepID=A0ABW3L5J8_9BACI
MRNPILNKAFQVMVILVMLVGSLIAGSNKGTVHADEDATLRVGWTQEIDSLSPFVAYTIAATEIFSLVYDPLVAFDNDVEPVARLAEKWEVSDDNKTWTFTLRDDVTWHDGEPFTSEDVKFTYETMKESGLGLYAGNMSGMESIETPDEHTVVIKTEEPKANMLQITAPILPEHIWSEVSAEELETWPNENPVGTGAFKFDEQNEGEYIKLVKNEDYFLTPAKINELVFVLYSNNDTMVQSLKVGEIGAAININPNQVAQLQQEENLDVVSATTHGFTELAINTWDDPASKGNPLLKDKQIRQAMEYAIDKQKLIDIAYAGQATEGTSLIPPSLDFWHYEPEDKRGYDPEKAASMLEEAGYVDSDGDGIRESEDGTPLNFKLMLRSNSTEEVKAGNMIADYFKDVGIGVEVETVDDGLLSDRIYDNANFDMFIWGWGTDADPSTILNVMRGEQIGGLSDSYYANDQYDQLFEEQETLIDRDERQAVVHEMQEILYDENPYIILAYDNALQAVNTEEWTGWTKVRDTYFLTFNHSNYMNVTPAVEGSDNVASADSGEAASADEESTNNGMMWGLIVGALLLGGIIFFIMKARGKKRFKGM